MPSGIRSRFDLTDAEWERLAELIPVPELGRRSWELRAQFNGIMWRFRCGTPWRDVPERYGNWNTVYDRFRTWRDDGTWARLLEAVLADAQGRGLIDWRTVSVDSTTNRAHQHAAGAVFEQATLEAFEESLAESGGKKGAGGGDETPLSRAELAVGLQAAIWLLSDPPPAHRPVIRR
jgi:transposase